MYCFDYSHYILNPVGKIEEFYMEFEKNFCIQCLGYK